MNEYYIKVKQVSVSSSTKKTFLKASEKENGEHFISPAVVCSTFSCFSCIYKEGETRRHAADSGKEGRPLELRSLSTIKHPLWSLE